MPTTPPVALLPGEEPQAPQTTPQSKFEEKKQWAHLYNDGRWKHPTRGLRAAVLRRDPVCCECKRQPSNVADHIIDHRGDLKLFWDINNLQGLCKECHDRKTGSQHGIGERTPPKPGTVNGKVVDYGPRVIVESKPQIEGFDFKAALTKHSKQP
jgi:5-methylcytosine-specific restriction protein A